MPCHIDDRDEAIPDLTYSIKELREKFVLETELLRGRMQRPGQFMFNGKEDEESQFDAPPAQTPQNYDFVDADADKAALRAALMAIQQARVSANKSDPQVEPKDAGAAAESPAGSGQE